MRQLSSCCHWSKNSRFRKWNSPQTTHVCGLNIPWCPEKDVRGNSGNSRSKNDTVSLYHLQKVPWTALFVKIEILFCLDLASISATISFSLTQLLCCRQLCNQEKNSVTVLRLLLNWSTKFSPLLSPWSLDVRYTDLELIINVIHNIFST